MLRRGFLSGARTRILASYVVLLLFSSGLGLLLLHEVLVARTGERVDDALTQETEEFRRLVRLGRDPRTGDPFGNDVKAMFDVFLSRNVPAETEAFYTFLGGEPYKSTIDPQLREDVRAEEIRRFAEVTSARSGEFTTSEGRVRYLAVPVRIRGTPRGVFVVTAGLSNELEEVEQALRVDAGVSIGVLLLASVLAWVIAGRVLAPLRLLADTARSISETDLTRRIPVEGKDEIAELARTFNAMLDRLESAFGSQKAFISDAGHELRTPITIIRGHLELLGEDPEERRETIALVTDELDRMSRLVDDLLLLAKAQRPDFLQLEELDLDVLTRELFTKASALAARDWQLEQAGHGRLRGDRQRLTQAVMNLAQNAVQHTKDRDPIAIGATHEGARARLWVRDKGPGLAETDRERIFERFDRGTDSAAPTDGAGLGLAIVRAIAESHGGRVEVHSHVGAGATFSLVIPTEPPREVPKR
jgi:two-component system OmpR family sensor kinase